LDHVDVFEIIGEGPASSAIVDAMIITAAKIPGKRKRPKGQSLRMPEG